MDYDLLYSLNPIFKVKDVQIIWSGNVYKVGQRNCLHQRLLVIASPGIFLIRKKPFNFQSHIITSISFFDLVSLYVTDQYASFSSKQSQIRVKLQNTKEIVSLVVFMRQAQFPTDVLPLNFTFVDEDIANLCTPVQLPYHPSSLFLDRTLSCILHFEISPSDSLLSEIPAQFFRRFIIKKEMLHNPLFPAWVLSLSYDRDIEILRFKSIKLCEFLEKSQYLFAFNKFVKTIEFEKVDFSNSEQVLSQLFHKPHCFKPIHWVFIECDLTKPNFSKFFNSISFIDKKITEIRFEKCTFSEDSIMETFQSIFFSECFHSISNLQFNSNVIISGKVKNSNFNENHINSELYNIVLSQFSEILCCSWVLQQKNLTQLSLISSRIKDITSILSQIFKFGTGLKYISLDDNNFISPINIDEESILGDSISTISLISFRNSRLSKSFILSLISLIKKGKVIFEGIDLSGIKIIDETEIEVENSNQNETENLKPLGKSGNNNVQIHFNDFEQIIYKNDDQNQINESRQIQDQNQIETIHKENLLDFLLNELQNVSMPSIRTLFFDENVMVASQINKFINFVKNQPNLKNLSVNCSIDISNSPSGFFSFIEYCSLHDLSALSIRGDREFSYGFLNLNLIQKIQSIECLDITNQRIGQKGLELLLPLIEGGRLKEVYFDGSNVSSFQFLCQFCSTLLTSKMKYASFPENDFNRILNFSNNSNSISLIPEPENDYLITYENLKSEFESVFYFSEYNWPLTIRNRTLKQKGLYVKSSKEKKISISQPFLMAKESDIHSDKKDELLYSKGLNIIENCISNHKVFELFDECVRNDAVEPSDTIVLLTRTIQDSLSFDNLFNSL